MSFLGINISKIRKKWDFGQADFAGMMRVKNGQIVSTYETGQAIPKIQFLVLLVKYSGIDLVTLYEKEVMREDIPNHPLKPGESNTQKTKSQPKAIHQDLQNYPALVQRVEELTATVQELLERMEELEG